MTLSAVASAFARGSSFLVSILLIALAARYLSSDQLGLWMTVVGLSALFSFADLGLGNGLINVIADAHGRGRTDEASAFVATAFYTLVGICAGAAAIFIGVYGSIDWAALFNVASAAAAAEAGPTVAVFVASLLSMVVLGLAQKIHFGYQESFLASVWAIVGSAFALGGGIVAILLEAGVPWLTLAVLGGPVVGVLLNSIALYWFQRPELRPRLSLVNRPAVKRLSSLGGLYLALSVAGALGYETDNIVIARILGADVVPTYALPFRLFYIVPTVLSFGLAPLWPAYAESAARGDVDWVKSTFIRSIRSALAVSVIASLFLVVFGRVLIRVWVGGVIEPSFALLFGFGLWTVITGVTGPFAMLLNGLGVVRFQVVASLTMGATNLALSIILVKTIGVAGAVYGTVVSMLVCIVVPATVYIVRMLDRMQSPGGNEP